MSRVALKMQLKPGGEAEYSKRHEQIWPELVELLRRAGLSNYSIYRDGLMLFACLEVEDTAALFQLAQEELMQKWWKYMEPLMECNEDSSPRVEMLEEVFHMD